MAENIEEKKLERLYSLHMIFKKNLGSIPGIYINLELLRNVVECYFRDLNSMKTDNNIMYADQHKRAAFSLLWIAKIRPIQLKEGAKVNDTLLLANEYFALVAGLAHLGLKVSDISPWYSKNLMHNLRFGQPSPELLASAMYLLESACAKKKP